MIIIHRNPFSHKGDTFRELVTMWQESGYCKINDCSNTLSWWGKVGDVLLYEFNQESVVPVPEKQDVSLGLFANYKPDWGMHWIFWARRPRCLEKKIKSGINKFKDRDVKSIFVGNNENDIQRSRRLNKDWSKSIDLYRMYNDGNHRYSQEDYLDMISRSRFGLCLAGFGRKCNREVECMGLGTVPIVASEVDMNYYDSPEEGVHYFRVKHPDEVKEITDNLSEEEWKRMSDNCIDWWNRNCSRRGSFETTQRIIEENYPYV